MKRLRKLLGIVLVVVVVALVILAAVSTWFVRRPWSPVTGTVAVAGLSAPVEVLRDDLGVPHIYAQNEQDLFFAQGYVHAQDRLWQMEFNRRIASGTLSAILGDATLGTDRFLRTLGLRRAAVRDFARLDGATKAILEAYAAGISAYIDSHRGRLPLEFTILGVEPEPWTPVDTLAWGGVMSYNLCGNYDDELLRARLIATVGQQAAQELMPPYPDGGPFVVPQEARSYASLAGGGFEGIGALRAMLGGPHPGMGSNNWVVHGSRTATGQPILADDTHLGLDMPSIWYENGLHGGRFDSVGYSFPGVPLVIIGHNARIAWGVTNLPADVQDLYAEKLDDRSQPTKYEFEGRWHDLDVVRETIEVKGAEPVELKVLITRHGPIMNEALGTPAGAEPLALRWTALEGNRLFEAVQGLNLAEDWEAFREALRLWEVPSQNFVYADVEGNIGYQSPGRIPIRVEGHRGSVPVPGWTGEFEWQGTIPFDELPSVLNPPTGWIASANNKVVPDEYPYLLTDDWSAPYRAQRISDLLAADDEVSLDDVQQIHAQTYSIPAEALRPILLTAQPQGKMEAKALELVRDWDLYLEVDRVGASIYQAWYWFLLQNTLADELGDELLDEYLGNSDAHVQMMINLMNLPDAAWFDDSSTSEVEGRDEILQRSLSDAVAWLKENHGANPDKWTWGRLHTKTFVHQPLGQSGIGLIEGLFNSRTILARGDGFAVDAAWFEYDPPFRMTGGASQRYIADLANFDRSRMIHTTGQSGQLFHRHREDMVALWQEVAYGPMPFSREAVEQTARTSQTLTPP